MNGERPPCTRIADFMKMFWGNMAFSTDNLPTREAEVVHHIRHGLSNKDISDRMGVKLSTVKTYVKRLYIHFGVCNRIQLLRRTGYLVAIASEAEHVTGERGRCDISPPEPVETGKS